MTRKLIAAITNLMVVAVLYLCLALVLPGCVTLRPDPDCPNPLGLSCQLPVSQPGIYEVRYEDERGQEMTGGFRPDSAGVINICDCKRIVKSEPLQVEPDLAVTMFASHDPVIVGKLVIYTVKITSTAQSANIDTLSIAVRPPGLGSARIANFTFHSSQGSTFGCSLDTESFAVCGGGLVFDQLDEVCPGCATVTFAVQPTEPGTLIVTVRATTSEFDPNLDNNTAAVSSTVVPSAPPAADLQITKIDTPDPVSVGQSVVYTITVRNNGPQAATGVRLIDPLPVTLPLIRVQTSQGTFSTIDQALVFEVGTIASGAEAVIMIEVSPTKAGSVTNAAFVNAAESDPNSANNRASTTTTVNP